MTCGDQNPQIVVAGLATSPALRPLAQSCCDQTSPTLSLFYSTLFCVPLSPM